MRSALKLSHEALAAKAGISRSWYARCLTEPFKASPTVLGKLEGALSDFHKSDGPPRCDERRMFVAATYGGFLLAVCRELALDPYAVRTQDHRRGATADRNWRALARARQMALYLTNTTLSVQLRPLAYAVGMTPAGVCLAIRTVEDLRDDPTIDAILDRCAALVTGAILV